MHFFDSRQVEVGGTYYALKGNKDGHDFLEEVALRGGVEAVVDEQYQGHSYGLHLVRVKSVLDELHRRAAEVQKPPIIGVTGSVGKTTTKEFIAEILKERFKVEKTPENYNSQISFPITVLNLKMADVWVLEMGMSYPGEINKLVQIAPPLIGVVTRIGLAHAMNFKDIDAIAEAKSEIFSSPLTQWKVVTEQAASFQAIRERGNAKLHLVPQGKGGPFSAAHINEDFSIAREVALLMGLAEEDIERAIPRLLTPKHRFHVFEKGGVTFVDDSYNSNPTSLLAALKNLPKAERKTIAVIGEMRELGPFSADSHDFIAEEASSLVDQVLLYGKETERMKKIFDQKQIPVEWFADKVCLKERLDVVAQKGDVVLVKGSKSNQLWEVC
ncbi:MAG: hypothetical protein KBC64_02545 [Simkaniaceae bacterium]|nr:hypothetical protein [Simkaniaceae bacterium]